MCAICLAQDCKKCQPEAFPAVCSTKALGGRPSPGLSTPPFTPQREFWPVGVQRFQPQHQGRAWAPGGPRLS